MRTPFRRAASRRSPDPSLQLPCGVGKYAATKAASTCAACPAGRANNAGGQSECLEVRLPTPLVSLKSCVSLPQCSVGSYANLNGSAICTKCPKGRATGAKEQKAWCVAAS